MKFAGRVIVVAGLAPYCATKFAMLGFFRGTLPRARWDRRSSYRRKPNRSQDRLFLNNESFGRKARNYTGTALDAKAVSRTVMAAANSPRIEITHPFYARGAVWFKHTLPYIVQPTVGAVSRRQIKS